MRRAECENSEEKCCIQIKQKEKGRWSNGENSKKSGVEL
jgi:hypothetical protein